MKLNQDKHVYMFAGKGGVGKTTCAAACALHFASLGENTLIISTDPTPSLADIFELKDAERGQLVKVAQNLYLEEIGLDEVKERWKAKFGPEVYEVVSAYMPIEPDYINYFAQAPGIGDAEKMEMTLLPLLPLEAKGLKNLEQLERSLFRELSEDFSLDWERLSP